jgi:hypothetical protein
MAESPTALDYRGNVVEPTVQQAGNTVTAPAALASIASVTLPPGTYTLAWQAGLDGGTPAAADENNFGLYVAGTRQLQSVNPMALGSWQQEPLQVTVGPGSTTVAVEAIGAGTAAVVYSAELVATPVAEAPVDAQLMPWASNPLTTDGTVVAIGPLSVTLNGFDATGAQAECQLGRGANTPAGTSDNGFVDTTYTLTAAQVQAGSQMGA